MVERHPHVRTLTCELDESERNKYARDAADLFHSLTELDAKKEAFDNEYKKESKAIELKMARLHGAAYSGTEMRQVDCVERWDYDIGMVYVIRKDTGEIHDRRPMTVEERQTSFI